MLQNLLRKEFKLSVHPTSWMFLLLAAMLFIPNYPYVVAFFYQTLAIFFMFLGGNTTNDIFFTTLLPVRKRDTVKARVLTVVILQLLQIIASIPFAILRSTLNPEGNLVGLDANIALFGLAFIMFGVFNLVFLTQFYKSAYKTGTPFLLACMVMTVVVLVCEIAIQINAGWRQVLDSTNPAYFPQQTAFLLFGMVVFALLTAAAYMKSAKTFEKLDL